MPKSASQPPPKYEYLTESASPPPERVNTRRGYGFRKGSGTVLRISPPDELTARLQEVELRSSCGETAGRIVHAVGSAE